jgi:hypothetical protein
MKHDVLDGAAVDARFRLGEQKEDCYGALFDRGLEFRHFERVSDHAPIDMDVAAFVMMALAIVAAGRGAASRDKEPAADQTSIIILFYPTGHAVEQSAAAAQILFETGLELWEQIDKPGDEHIAGYAADQVEMDVHAVSSGCVSLSRPPQAIREDRRPRAWPPPSKVRARVAVTRL